MQRPNPHRCIQSKDSITPFQRLTWLCGRFGGNEPRAETDATVPEQGGAHPTPVPTPGKMQGGSLRSADSE
jgi:hypothetical protein